MTVKKRKVKKKHYTPTGRKNKRSQMQESNRQARKFLFAEGFDAIWMKSHTDSRRGGSDYYYLSLDQKAKQCTDVFNLFDGCCYDADGQFWWVQIKTDQWPPEEPIKNFMIGKSTNIMAINVKKPTKTRKNYTIATREWSN